MRSKFDLEQIELLNEVDAIRNKGLPKKLTGRSVCTVISEYIQRYLPANYKVSNPDSYVAGVSTEFDLLVVRAGAQHGVAGYEPSDVQVVLEVKTAGMRASRQKYPLEVEKIREKFDKLKMKNAKMWGALLMCYGTIRPKKQASINYEKIRKRGLEPYNYGVYTLAGDEPEWGKWGKFIEDLLSKLN